MPKLDHVALEVSNLDRAVQFYTEDLGFTLKSRATNEEQQEEYCFLVSEGTCLELISDLQKAYREERVFQRPYCPHICFATDDMEETFEELRARDIEIIRGPLEIAGEETWVYFADPDGNVLEYIHWYK
jgi:lactoylglutathione lyase